MAAKFFQNQNSFVVAVPTAEGISVNVDPGKFVKDSTGVVYTRMSVLTEVAERFVVARDLVYTYAPVEFVTVDPDTGQIPVGLDPSGASGISGYSGATGASGYSGAAGTIVIAGTFADNAAAKTGGLTDGEYYRTTTGQVMVVFTAE